MNINWERIARTTIQVGAASAITLINTIINNFSRESIITALITFVSTIAISFLMNISKEVDDNDIQ